ncbi:Pentatricopeptide repeat-containing protein [Vitis vinifera]|uniref:Pentatricopeptide repeat-containing protein n=1 Tax=Vitis vinifera TaxID=29760 RepID=A0A438E9Q5_VITVI|nr:Pentatricopeptide repeat-containing protein [Vitis vinifera]
MLNKGHGADSLVYNNLISGFLNLENEAKAIELFDELKERCLVYDGVVNGTFMDWYFTKGREKCAMDSYKSLFDRQFRMTPVTCNAPAVNSDSFSVMVNECVKLGKFTEAIEVFKKVGKKQGSKPFAMDVAGYNNIIARFCENGLLSEAEQLFGELSTKSLTPDVNIYRTFIEAYFGVERADDALQMFNRFVDSGLRVIVSFANKVFDELVNKGKVGECVPVLTKMGEKDPKPDPTTYEIVIKGLCKERLFDASRDLMGQMVRYNIGVTPSLREFVVEAFGKEGRSEEIERLLEANRPGFGAYWPPSGPPRMAGPLEWQGLLKWLDPLKWQNPLKWQDLLEWQNPPVWQNPLEWKNLLRWQDRHRHNF